MIAPALSSLPSMPSVSASDRRYARLEAFERDRVNPSKNSVARHVRGRASARPHPAPRLWPSPSPSSRRRSDDGDRAARRAAPCDAATCARDARRARACRRRALSPSISSPRMQGVKPGRFRATAAAASSELCCGVAMRMFCTVWPAKMADRRAWAFRIRSLCRCVAAPPPAASMLIFCDRSASASWRRSSASGTVGPEAITSKASSFGTSEIISATTLRRRRGVGRDVRP